MDIQKLITEALGKLQGSEDLLALFKKDPIATVKKLLGAIDLNNDQLKAIADGISAKLKLDDAKGMLNALGGLFGKK